MDRYPWARLEEAVCRRNPRLNSRLQPGLSEAKIKKMLEKAGLKGAIEPLVQLYSWKNGMIVDFELRASKSAFFPQQEYFFLKLDRAIDSLRLFREATDAHPENPKLTEALNRYFPFMSNGSVKFIAVDLAPLRQNRIMLIDMDADEPFRQAYPTFADFIEDVIRANDDNAGLACFLKNA